MTTNASANDSYLLAIRAKLSKVYPQAERIVEPVQDNGWDGSITSEEWAELRKAANEQSERIRKEQDEFDWFGPAFFEKPAMPPELAFERKLHMLEPLKSVCSVCTMCELGRKLAIRDGDFHNPHVFSNMNPTRFVVVGQNPGWTEVCKKEPFVGESGDNFDRELAMNGLTRDDFYICNTVRCYTDANARPTEKHVARCRPFLDMEINLIQPLLVAALGAVAFARLCPGVEFNKSLGNIVESSVYEVPVFALYHPSPLNLQEPERAVAFSEQMRLLCGLVKRLKARQDRPVRSVQVD